MNHHDHHDSSSPIPAAAKTGSCCATHDEAQVADSVTDPVCGMSVDPHTAQHRAEYQGRTWYFCSAHCREKFLAEPTRHLSDPAAAAPVPQGTLYTCPMHPEVQKVGPGTCPKCGMALEPMMPSAEQGDSELVAVRRRFWISAALALPLLVIAMGPHLFGIHVSETTARTLRWAELLLSAPLVLWAGLDYYRRGWLGLVHRSGADEAGPRHGGCVFRSGGRHHGPRAARRVA